MKCTVSWLVLLSSFGGHASHAQAADSAQTAARTTGFKFAFGKDEVQPGYTHIAPQTTYDAKRGFGFLKSAPPGQPSVFAVDVEEGNYDVTIRFGDRPQRDEPEVLRRAWTEEFHQGFRSLPGEHVPRSGQTPEGRHASQCLRRLRTGALHRRRHQGGRAFARTAPHLAKDVGPFDPSNPDPPDKVDISASPLRRKNLREINRENEGIENVAPNE